MADIAGAGYAWIKVPRQTEPTGKIAKDYRMLVTHHLVETTFLIDKCRELAKELIEHRKKEGHPWTQ